MSGLLARILATRQEVTDLARTDGGRSVAVFGSVARGEETALSDIDFLVEFEPGSSLFDLLRLKEALAGLFDRSVDVVSSGGLLARDQHILDEAVRL